MRRPPGSPECAPARWARTRIVPGDGRTPLLPDQMPAALALRRVRVCEKALVLGLGDGTRRYFSVNASAFGDVVPTTGVVVTVHDVTEQRKVQLELAHLAAHDPLTGLANRTLLTEAVPEAALTAEHDGAGAALILLDLDGSKRINDSLGHAFGDQVLQAVAARLQSVLRVEDLVDRLGGASPRCS